MVDPNHVPSSDEETAALHQIAAITGAGDIDAEAAAFLSEPRPSRLERYAGAFKNGAAMVRDVGRIVLQGDMRSFVSESARHLG